MKIKKGDTVQMISGDDKGRSGRVTSVEPGKDRISIAGINMHKKHVKPQGSQQPGGIVDMPLPVHVSNVMLVCPKCKEPSRVTYTGEGKNKHRVCKNCEELIS